MAQLTRRVSAILRVSAALLVLAVAAGCDDNDQRAQPGLEVTIQPCRLTVDSPADGQIDATYDIAYRDGRPTSAHADMGGGDVFCVGFQYDHDRLVAKTVDNDCDGPQEPIVNPIRRVRGSNLVEVRFPDDQTTYRYVVAPGDFTFLLTRTSYALGPQRVHNIHVRDGRLQSLELAKPSGTTAYLDTVYDFGRLLRVSEKDDNGRERGWAKFSYDEGRLTKVERKIATMQGAQREAVTFSYACP